MVAPPVSVAMHVAAVTISIATSIGTSLLLSPTSDVCRSLLSHTLTVLGISVRTASFLG